MFLEITAATKSRSLLKAIRELNPSLQELSKTVERATGLDSGLVGLAVWLVDEPPTFRKVTRPSKGQQDVFVGYDTASLGLGEEGVFRRYLADRTLFAIEGAAFGPPEKEVLVGIVRSWGRAQ